MSRNNGDDQIYCAGCFRPVNMESLEEVCGTPFCGTTFDYDGCYITHRQLMEKRAVVDSAEKLWREAHEAKP